MTPFVFGFEGKQIANLRRKPPPKADASWVGRPTGFLPRPSIPLAPLAKSITSMSVAHEKMKSRTEFSGPGFEPSVDWSEILSMATSPNKSIFPVTVFSGIR